MSENKQTSVRVGIGKYLLKTALFWGIISLVAAILLYMVSFNSLRGGLTATNAVAEQNAALLAFAFNLIEIVALVWVFVDEFVGGDDKDTFVDLFVKGVLLVILAGDCFAIFYDTGYTTNLPGNTFGNILTICLRAIGAIIGGTGSETFILLGGMIIWVWWLNYSGKAIEHHKPTNTPAPAPAPAPHNDATTSLRPAPCYTLDPNGAQPPAAGKFWFPIGNAWATMEEAALKGVKGIVTQGPPPAAPAQPPAPAAPAH